MRPYRLLAALALATSVGAIAWGQPQAGSGRPDPIVLVEPEHPGSPVWPSVLAVGAAAGLVATAWILWRRAEAAEPADAAFRRMARLLRLSIAERRLVRALARAHGASGPAALLLSHHAFRQACKLLDDARRPALARLQRKLGPPT